MLRQLAQAKETGAEARLPIGAAPCRLVTGREPARDEAEIGLMQSQHHVEFP